MPLKDCRDGDLCKKYPDCPFKHKEECKYGFGCKNKLLTCQFMHPKFKFEKEIEEKAKIIIGIVTKSTICRHKTECSNFKC